VVRTRLWISPNPETVEAGQLAQGSRGEETEGTHRYEDRATQMILRNRVARRASRDSNSKAAGPNAPTETLSHDHRSSRVHGRERKVSGERENTKNMLLYCVSVLRSGGTGRTHRILDLAPESRVYQRRPTSRFNAVRRRRARPSLRNLSTFDLVDCFLIV
jgi:hypothetical protein